MINPEQRDQIFNEIYGNTTPTTISKSKPRIVTFEKKIPVPTPPRRKRHFWRFLFLIVFVIVAGLGVFAVLRAKELTSHVFVGKTTSFYKPFVDFIRGNTDSNKLIGEDLGQINILLLGIGGEGHDGGYLSDTIILLQIRPDLKKATMTSIPRDYLINLPRLGQRKINAAFAESYLETKDFDTAGRSAREVISKLSGIDIPYFAVLDFKGFEKAIDLLGGVDVTVDRTFTDSSYPDSEYGYLPPITFKEGPAHMDGTKALQFARSRHAAGPEGTDFARSQRQQKIIQAVKEKVTKLNFVTDAGKINNLLGVLSDHFHTNISPEESFRLYGLVKNFQRADITSQSLDPDTRLICPKILEESGAYVLIPCPGKTTTEIEDFFKNSFDPKKAVAKVVWLMDSTGDSTRTAALKTKLTDDGLDVQTFVYTGKALKQTVFYQTKEDATLTTTLSTESHGTQTVTPPPGITVDPNSVDAVVIIGADGVTVPVKKK